VTVRIDPSRCQGHAACLVAAPEVFDLDEEGRGVVLLERPGREQLARVRAAVLHCPEAAVSVEEAG
jgi:ferredoxin